MDNRQRTFLLVMGMFQILMISGMLGWMAFDAYRAFRDVSQQPFGQFLAEPIIWHKLGELLIAIPVGIAFAAFFMLWKAPMRVRFLQITTPLIILGGLFNLIAAWGFYQKPRTDFTTFMIYFCPLLFLAGLGLPLALRWIHHKRAQIESQPTANP